MGMLEFRAIHLDHQPGIPKKNLRSRFHDARLAGPCWPQEKQVAYRPARRIQPGAEYLVQINQRLDPFFLANDLGAQRLVKIACVVAADGRVKLLSCRCLHGAFPERCWPPCSSFWPQNGISA